MREELIKQYFDISVTVQRTWKHRVFAALEDEHISMAQMGLLFIIEERQPVASKELATYLRVTRSAIAQLIDGLDERGYIERNEDDKDRRILHISLSSNGELVLRRLEKRRRKIFEDLVCELSDEQLTSGIEIQESMLRRLGK